jgi:hypothetical protein
VSPASSCSSLVPPKVKGRSRLEKTPESFGSVRCGWEKDEGRVLFLGATRLSTAAFFTLNPRRGLGQRGSVPISYAENRNPERPFETCEKLPDRTTRTRANRDADRELSTGGARRRGRRSHRPQRDPAAIATLESVIDEPTQLRSDAMLN